jgi:hypothetical protein
LQPFDNVVLISAATRRSGGSEESLFQLPRSDSFLRAFARMAYVADQMLRDLLADMERLARHRNPSANA